MTDKSKLPKRFWDKTQTVPSGCWLWIGCIDRGGYGWFRMNGKSQQAHRIAYEALIGIIPNELQIDHLCRVRNCVNPMHMEPVSHAENIRRGIAGQTNRERQLAKTHCPQGHEYTGSNLYISPTGKRNCRTCQRHRTKTYQERLTSGRDL